MKLTEQSLRDAALANSLAALAAALLPADNPERIWAEWVQANLGDLPTAAYKLGVDVEDGPNYVARLKAGVLAKLTEANN